MDLVLWATALESFGVNYREFVIDGKHFLDKMDWHSIQPTHEKIHCGSFLGAGVTNNIKRRALRVAVGCAAAVWLAIGAAIAGPWAEVGDAQLRSDIDILATAGVIDNMTMTWPIPWDGILNRLDQPNALASQPDYVRDAAFRVRERGVEQTPTGVVRASISIDAASNPAVVRGFDALGRQTAQGQATVEYLSDTTAMHLSVGGQTANRTDRQTLVADGSYIAQRLGNAAIYAGYRTHWWGPGWISAMSLSNNARPVPQIGITRIDTTPFESPWLSWLGPWQMEFFVGVLDGPRIARNTIYDGFRFNFSPLPHLEIALARTDEMCGTGHPCKPIAYYVDLTNQNNNVNHVNDEGTIDVRYSGAFAHLAYEVYLQFMNEDTNPFIHSGTSHLFGASAWLPIDGGVERLTVEYANSLATYEIWGGGIQHGFSYNNGGYPDGMRYRDRTLGFSLDSDSQLLSVQADFTDEHARAFTLTYHRALVSDPLNTGRNVVTTAPATINILEGRMSLPLKLSASGMHLDLVGRLQDDQPRPDKGFEVSVEAALTINL